GRRASALTRRTSGCEAPWEVLDAGDRAIAQKASSCHPQQMYIHFYIHFPPFAANRSRPWTAAHLDFWLVSAENRTWANGTEYQRTPWPRTHKPLVAGSNPAAATRRIGLYKPKIK